jgi:alcohol dehydrogenase class IV
MMYFFEFKMPGRTLCIDGGDGRLGKLMDRLGGNRILVVTDEGVRKVGLVDKVIAGIDRQSAQVAGVFDSVGPDPDVSTIESCAGMARECDADCLVSIGGGSAIDTAKATLIRLRESGDLLDYEWNEYFASGPLLPHVAIPTTAGTGSEATHVAMITDKSRNRKLMYQGGDLLPAVAVLDPQMTVTLPPHITAATGMDALTHSIEAIHSIWHQPMTDGLALSAIELVSTFLEKAFKDGGDAFARMNMLLAANMGGTAAANAFIAIVHATAHPIGAIYHVPHGDAVAVMLPYAMEMNLQYDGVPARYKRVASALGLAVEGDDDMTASRKAIGRIREMIARLGLPRRLTDLDIPAESLGDLADEDMADHAIMVTPGNPGREDVLELLKRAL